MIFRFVFYLIEESSSVLVRETKKAGAEGESAPVLSVFLAFFGGRRLVDFCGPTVDEGTWKKAYGSR